MNHGLKTNILYVGNKINGIAENPDCPPIYPATAYCVKDTADYDFANCGGKYFYNRTANPNRDALAQAINYLENGESTIICSSGMAAISTTLLGLLKSGDHAVMSSAVYGETIELIENVMKDFDVEVTFVDFTDEAAVEKAIKKNTVLLYTEIISNPLTLVVDIDKITTIAKKHNILTVVDSTFTTPMVIRPLDHGADIVIHSLTKYFGGHSDITGGSITSTNDIIKRLTPKFLLFGSCLDPNSSWLLARSVRTMEMRVKAQNYNAVKIAEFLSLCPKVHAVHHPSVPTHPQHDLALKYFPEDMCGAIVSFRVDDDIEKVNKFIGKLNIIKYLGTLGGIRTTLTHPATAFMREFSKEELEKMGLFDGLIRISVGAEDADDLIGDLNQALEVF